MLVSAPWAPARSLASGPEALSFHALQAGPRTPLSAALQRGRPHRPRENRIPSGANSPYMGPESRPGPVSAGLTRTPVPRPPDWSEPVMTRRKKIYEGKAKILYEGPEPGTLIQYFKDDATAFNAQKKAVLEGKGVINNRISEFVMTRLNAIGVQNHFIRRLNLREQLIKEVEIIPLE